MAKWVFTGCVSMAVRVEVEAPASFPVGREAARYESETARRLAKAKLHEVAGEALARAAELTGSKHGWQVDELEVDGDPVQT